MPEYPAIATGASGPESQVTGLVADLAAKAPIASPTFTGTATGPRFAHGVNAFSQGAGAYNIDASLGDQQIVTLTANAGAATITNPVLGQELTIEWKQDATGGRTYTLPASVTLLGQTWVASTAAGARDVLRVRYNGSTWIEMVRGQNASSVLSAAVYNVKTGYAAKGDAVIVTDGAITSGTNALACATSTPFTSTAVDGGKLLAVQGAGAAGATLVTTIVSVTNSGHAVLAANAGTTVSAANTLFGTDDTTSISNAIAAAHTANRGVVYFPGGNYISGQQTVHPYLTYQGEGPDSTTITLKPGSTTSLFSGLNFATLTGTTAAQGAGAHHFTFERMSLDGNKAMNPSGGRCFEVFGFEFIIDRLHAHRSASDGCWLEGRYASDTPLDVLGADFDESMVSNCKFFSNGVDGLHTFGIHDSTFIALISALNTTNNFYCGASGNWVNCHAWGAAQYGYQIVGTESLVNCSSEGATIANYWLTFNDQHIVGGRCFAPAPATVGVMIGKSGAACADAMVDGLGFEGFSASTGAPISFTSGATITNAAVRGRVNMPSGTVIAGTVPTDTQLDVKVGGGVGGPSHIIQAPAGLVGGGLLSATDFNLLGANADQRLFGGSRGVVAGVPWGIKVKAHQAGTISKVWLNVHAAGATLTAGQNFVGVCDSTGALIGVSADVTTTFGATGLVGIPVTVQGGKSLACLPGQVFYVMILPNGTGLPTFLATGWSADAAQANPNMTAAGGYSNFTTAQTAQTTMPASFVLSTCTANGGLIWAGIS